MTAWGSEKGLKPPNTRATSPAPQGSHTTTTTQVDTHNTHKTMEARPRGRGQGHIDRKKELKLSGCSQERDSFWLWPPKVPQMSPKSGLLLSTPKSLPVNWLFVL